MFSIKKETVAANRVDTIIGKECSFKGNLEVPGGNVRIDGYCDGDIHIGGDLVIGESGNVAGDIVAKNIMVAGKVDGMLEADEKLELSQTARVLGDIKMKILIINDGAFLQGKCTPKEAGQTLQLENPTGKGGHAPQLSQMPGKNN